MWKYCEICCGNITVYIKEKKKQTEDWKKKKVQVPHENFTVDEQWMNSDLTLNAQC